VGKNSPNAIRIAAKSMRSPGSRRLPYRRNQAELDVLSGKAAVCCRLRLHAVLRRAPATGAAVRRPPATILVA